MDTNARVIVSSSDETAEENLIKHSRRGIHSDIISFPKINYAQPFQHLSFSTIQKLVTIVSDALMLIINSVIKALSD